MANIKVPSLDLKIQYQGIKPEIDAAIARVLDSCQFVLGSEVAGFEREFAAYCGADECIALNSGTSALHLALLAAGVGPGDEVVTVPFTFVASVAAVLYTGARPVLVDIDPRSFTMDRYRSPLVHHGSCSDRGGDHTAHQSDPARASLWSTRRHGPDHGSRAAARLGCDRRCRAGARSEIQRPPRWQYRGYRVLQFLSRQESGGLR